MSKYSPLGVCQPQRGGLSYFCGLVAATRRTPGHSVLDCRAGDGPTIFLPPDGSSTCGSLLTLSLLLLLLLLFLQLQLQLLLSIRDLPRAVTLNSSALSGRLCQCRIPLRGLRDPRGNRRDWMRKSGGKDGRRGICRFWQVEFTCRFHGQPRKRGLRGSINMRMTRAASFCALPHTRRWADIFMPTFMNSCLIRRNLSDGRCVDENVHSKK